MTVSSEQSFIVYNGDGTTKTFTIPFYFLLGSDISITLTDTSGSEVVLVYGVNFSVVGDGSPSGGAATLNTAPPSGYTVNIYRNPPVTQQTAYQENGKFPAKSHEKALDKLTMLIQSVIYKLNVFNSKSVKVPEAGNWVAPKISDRNNRIFAWDNDGKPIAVLPQTGSASDVLIQLASSADGKGDALISVKQPFTGATPRTQHDFNAQFVSVKDFFLSSDTSYDAAFSKAAIACISNNVGLRIPSGDYYLTQSWIINLITGKNLLILGDGSNVTRLFFRGSANGISISAEVCQEWDAGSVIVKGISIITSNVNSGTALYINQNQVTGIPGGPIITEDLIIRGENTHTQQWGTGIVYNRVEGTITRDVGIYGYAQSSLGDGIEFRGTTDDVSTQHIMDNCRLWFLNRAVVANAYNQGIFYNCVNVFNCNYALDWDARAEAYGQTELHVFNSQFSVHNAGFNISKIGYITAAGNMFIGATESTSPPTIFFRLNGCWEYSITTNNFVGGGHRNCIGFEIANDVPNPSTANQSNYNGLIAMNTFDSMDVAILIESDSVSPHIRNNIYTISVTNTVVNNSSSPVVREDSVFKFTGTVTFATSNALQRVTVSVPAGLFRGTPDIATIHWNGDYVMFGNFQSSESSATSLVFTIRRYDGLAFNGGPFGYSVRASQ